MRPQGALQQVDHQAGAAPCNPLLVPHRDAPLTVGAVGGARATRGAQQAPGLRGRRTTASPAAAPRSR
eukprot:9289305-Alexandrium_andersonii.AAC.1